MATIVALIFLALLIPATLSSASTVEVVEVVVPILKPVELPAIMNVIASCESGGIQFYEDGSLVKHMNYRDGVHWSTDWGLFQINDVYHLETAEALGIDIMTEEGNKKFAMLLYNTAGTTPWEASQYCWQK